MKWIPFYSRCYVRKLCGKFNLLIAIRDQRIKNLNLRIYFLESRINDLKGELKLVRYKR